jgi:hypothetical protein
MKKLKEISKDNISVGEFIYYKKLKVYAEILEIHEFYLLLQWSDENRTSFGWYESFNNESWGCFYENYIITENKKELLSVQLRES